LHRIASLRADYALLGPLRYEIEQHGAEVIDIAYTEDVRLEVAVPEAALAALAAALSDLSNGAIALEDQVVATRYLLCSPELPR